MKQDDKSNAGDRAVRRRARLEQALRDNLLRRKDQARARRASVEPDATADASGDGDPDR